MLTHRCACSHTGVHAHTPPTHCRHPRCCAQHPLHHGPPAPPAAACAAPAPPCQRSGGAKGARRSGAQGRGRRGT
eukprot:2284399-Rhodomonas_salina.1